MKKYNKKHREFSKILLIQESILIWIITIVCLILSFLCVLTEYLGELGILSTIIVSSWTAYGVSQAFYYNKSTKENTKGGIKFETVLAAQKEESDEEDMSGL